MPEQRFTPNPSMLAELTGVMRRIIESGRQPVFTLEHWKLAKEFFEKHPEEDTVRIYPGGQLFGESFLRRIIRSRATNVAFAQSHGWFPMVMSRRNIEFWIPA